MKYEVKIFKNDKWVSVKFYGDWFTAYAVASALNQVSKITARVVTDDGKIVANYGEISDKMIKFELHSEKDAVTLKVNGKQLAVLLPSEATSSVLSAIQRAYELGREHYLDAELIKIRKGDICCVWVDGIKEN